MKHMKKTVAAMLVVGIVSVAAPMSVLAGTVTEGDENPKTDGDFKVSYTYTPELPKFTVTIPAGVTLSDNAATTANITAEGVEHLVRKEINVELTSGTYTSEGSTFHAKNGNSVVTYTISKGNDTISVGDKVAVFKENGSETLTFSQPDKTTATVAGEHTENLTFTVSLTDPLIGRTFKDGDIINIGDNVYVYSNGVPTKMPKGFTLRYLSYDHGMRVHNYQIGGSVLLRVSDDNSGVPTAITITGGSGTLADPYTFTAVH